MKEKISSVYSLKKKIYTYKKLISIEKCDA